MADRTELMQAILDSLPDGIALLGREDEVIFWNQAAEALLGYARADLLSRPFPDALLPLLNGAQHDNYALPCSERKPGHGLLVHVRHQMGHEMPTIACVLVLRDELGKRVGTAAIFHPADSVDALPHGESSADEDLIASQEDLEERLRTEFDNFISGGSPFGILWIAVDQAGDLHKTHGAAACQAMLDKIRHAFSVGLRPVENMGRWGDDEFLVICHERTPEMLDAHARVLAGLARTADFCWWGDRVPLTISVGAVQASQEQTESLAQLLDRAREAMESSVRAGGNCVTSFFMEA
jgi:PAS domain S-box-containing protein/diguanylate cyclase (GGDEF)-like protein